MKNRKTVIAAAIAIAATAVVRGAMPTPAPLTAEPFVIKKSADETDVVKIAPRKAAPMRARALDVPFREDFSSASTLGDWGIQDMNNDGDSWEYKESFQLVACYFATNGGANDDWLVSPAINLGKDDIYTLTFSYGSQGSRFKPEALTVTMGTSEYATRHTTVLYTDNEILNFWNGSMKTVTVTLPVEEDGTYYFGFHCTTPSGGYCLYLDDIAVEQNGSYEAPDAVENLTVVPDASGMLSAQISLVTPTTTASGKPLTSIESVKIYRDDKLVYTFDNPAPGAPLTHTDTGMATGVHTYKAIACAGGEDGAKAEVTAFVGIDTPLAVTGLTGVEQGSDVVITWEAPLGANGGYVGPDAVTYSLVRIEEAGEVTLASSLKSLTYTDHGVSTDTQKHVYYTVTAHTATGEAPVAASNSLFVGPAYKLPFTENFEYCSLLTSPWVMEYINPGYYPTTWRTTAMGAIPACPPVDGDDGMLEFVSKISGFNLYAGNIVRLATPVIDFSSAQNPYVEFYLFHYDTTDSWQEYDSEAEQYVTVTTEYADKLHLQVAFDNGEYTDLPGSEIMLAKNNGGWTQYRIPLEDCKGHAKVSVALVGTSDGGGNICIDHFKVSDTYASDLAFTGLMGPGLASVGETAVYTANIINNGTASTKAYSVDLFVDGDRVASAKGQGAAIFANGGEKTVKLEFTPGFELSGNDHELYAVINFADDECLTNNRSQSIQLSVPPMNDLPRVASLTGETSEHGVALSWDEPDMSNVRGTVTDKMESYQPFAISGIGSYTLIDNDKASATYTVSNIQSYPNAGGAMAWQVFDPKAAGIDTELDFNRRWTCHSGSQCLISWGADASTGVTANDDWLISPELSGDSQKITFYIKSVTMAYPERFRVLYSTDTRSISDFVKVAEANYYSPVSYWRKFSVTLPSGAKYFAIQCISADAFGLMVDDVTFSPKSADLLVPDFMGYNVYRDGQKLNDSPLGEPSYTDIFSDSLDHTYFVTALYTDGESAPSGTYTSGISGVYQPFGDTEFTAIGHDGCLEVDGCNGLVEVFAASGWKAAAHMVKGSLTFSIAPGVYIIRCNGKTIKAIVR